MSKPLAPLERLARECADIWIVDDGLISASEAEVLAQRLPSSDLPRSAQLALRGLTKSTPHPFQAIRWPGVMQGLAACLGQTADALPWASWAAQADGLNPDPQSHWAFLTTGHLQMTPQQVRLLPCPSPSDPDWQQALEAGLREGFECASEALSLHRGHSGQLYLQAKPPIAPLPLQSMHPALLMDHHLPDALPEGEGARIWRKASQLACMLTYDWSRDHGYPDALWLWGPCEGGQVMEPSQMKTGDDSPDGLANAPLWLSGFHQAWSHALGRAAPRIHWRPLPSTPAPGETMVDCWAGHWSGLLSAIDRSSLLIAGLKDMGCAWALSPTPAASWQLGLAKSPHLRDLAPLLATASDA